MSSVLAVYDVWFITGYSNINVGCFKYSTVRVIGAKFQLGLDAPAAAKPFRISFHPDI